MRFAGILPGGQSKPDMGTADDQGRAPVFFGSLDGRIDRLHIIAICHTLNMPIICLETGGAILGKGDIGGTVDRDAVVIVEIDDFAQF